MLSTFLVLGDTRILGRGVGRALRRLLDAGMNGETWALVIVGAFFGVLLLIGVVTLINVLGTRESQQVELTDEEKRLLDRYQ